jgi:NAD(P)-dependent dehydrogenase (short-subunit alcohol dehydrogenase family)
VTGGSGGVGRAVAENFARRGVRKFVTARSENVLEAAARQRASAHPRAEAVAVTADVAAPDPQTGVAETRRQWEVNVLGAFHGTRAVLPAMRRQGSGALIDVAPAAP